MTQSFVSLDCWYKWINLLIFRIAILSELLFYRVCLQTAPDVHKLTKSRAKVPIRIILHFYCCMMSVNIILMSFFYHYYNQTATQALIKLGDVYGFVLHFQYSLHDAHQPEDFELQLIFGFEQSSFGCRKKPSLTSPFNKL